MANLVEKWQSGDEGAFEALFHQYKDLVFKTALAMNGDRKEAEDIMQEVFVKAWNARQSFDPKKGKLTTWLHRITMNVSVSKYRKNGHKMTSLETAQNIGFQLGDLEDTVIPEEDAIRSCEHEVLLRAVRSMNGTHRPVVVLRYFNELSYNEIAQVLEIPLGTVKSRLNEAIRILRRELSQEGLS